MNLDKANGKGTEGSKGIDDGRGEGTESRVGSKGREKYRRGNTRTEAMGRDMAIDGGEKEGRAADKGLGKKETMRTHEYMPRIKKKTHWN